MRTIFFHLPPTSSRLHPLQVENCDSNYRLVVDEDENGKLRLETVNPCHDYSAVIDFRRQNLTLDARF